MQTSAWQHNYRNRRNRLPTAEQAEREKRTLDWLGDCLKWEHRGLITKSEFIRLLDDGPEKSTNTVAG